MDGVDLNVARVVGALTPRVLLYFCGSNPHTSPGKPCLGLVRLLGAQMDGCRSRGKRWV